MALVATYTGPDVDKRDMIWSHPTSIPPDRLLKDLILALDKDFALPHSSVQGSLLHMNNHELEALILAISQWQNHLRHTKITISHGQHHLGLVCLQSGDTILGFSAVMDVPLLLAHRLIGTAIPHPKHSRMQEHSSGCSFPSRQGNFHRVESPPRSLHFDLSMAGPPQYPNITISFLFDSGCQRRGDTIPMSASTAMFHSSNFCLGNIFSSWFLLNPSWRLAGTVSHYCSGRSSYRLRRQLVWIPTKLTTRIRIRAVHLPWLSIVTAPSSP